MTKWKARGELNGNMVEVWFQRGKLGGDEMAVAEIERIAAELEGQLVGPPGGPFTYNDHAKDIFSASAIAEMVFENTMEGVDGDGDGRGDLDDGTPPDAIL